MCSLQKNDSQTDVYKRLEPWQRLEAACELYWFARKIIENRERLSHPEMDARTLEKRVRSFFK